ncbi:MAG: ABC transporter permease [Chitinophagales bacterium]|nr:ABC transporter permease [Chitinophagales bacterium]MDW8418450.1 ABC transporter permease [Chitinophagales bacterium]
MEKEITSVSLNEKAWRRLKRNRSAMFGLGIIVLAVILAVFAYVVSPDNSPSANEQILPLETHEPGFRIHILKKYRRHSPGSSLVEGLWGGFIKNYDPVPVTQYRFTSDTLLYTEYRGKNFPPVERSAAYNDILGGGYDTFTPLQRKVLVEECCLREQTYLLGTDKFGRDILSRLIIGVRVSLSVGLISVGISLLIGVLLGALAGYFRGWIDQCIMWIINVFWSIPTLLLAMGLYISAGSWIENKLVLIFIAVGLTMWVDTARIVRGQFMAVRELEFVTAARGLAYGDLRIIFRHILPNITGPIIVVACSNFAGAILIESGLSYIGLGIQPPAPSWGTMLNEYKDFINTDRAYLALFPSAAIMLLVLAFNLLGNGLRDALDVKGRTE